MITQPSARCSWVSRSLTLGTLAPDVSLIFPDYKHTLSIMVPHVIWTTGGRWLSWIHGVPYWLNCGLEVQISTSDRYLAGQYRSSCQFFLISVIREKLRNATHSVKESKLFKTSTQILRIFEGYGKGRARRPSNTTAELSSEKPIKLLLIFLALTKRMGLCVNVSAAIVMCLFFLLDRS